MSWDQAIALMEWLSRSSILWKAGAECAQPHVLCSGLSSSRPMAPTGPAKSLQRRGGPRMLRSRFHRTTPLCEPLVVAEGYNFLSATAVPGRSRLRASLASGSGADGVGGLRSMSGRVPGLDLPRAVLLWAEPITQSLRLKGPWVTAFGAAGWRVPRCLSGGFAQLCSI